MKRSRHSLLARGRAVLVVALLLVTLPWAVPAHAASFTVDWPYDEFDMNPGDGACVSTPSGGCTLRAAVQEAEANPAAPHDITISPAFTTYALVHGDLDIVTSTNLTITGNGAGQTIISSNGNDRLFEIGPGAKLTIFKVTIIGGRAKEKLFSDYRAHGHGGAIHNHGTLLLADSIVANSASAPNWNGGGITNASASYARLINVTVADNTTELSGGGIENGGALWLLNVTLYANMALNKMALATGGGGLYNIGSAALHNTVVAHNQGAGMARDCAGSQAIISGGFNLSSDASCNFSATTNDLVNAEQHYYVTNQPQDTYTPLRGAAIDAGHPDSGTLGMPCRANDQFGVARPVDSNGDGVARCDIGAVEAVPTIDLAISVTDSPDPAVMGRPLTYAINATNYGPESTNLSIHAALPATLTVSRITISQGASQASCAHSNLTLSCIGISLAVGDSVQVWVEGVPTTAKTISFTASVVSPKPDRNSANDTAIESTTVNPPPLGPNLLNNPGFERDDDGDGLPDDWSGNSDFFFIQNDQTTHSGGYSGLYLSTEGTSYIISQRISGLTAGQTYICSGYVQIPPDMIMPFSIEIQVQWIDSNGMVINAERIRIDTRPTGNTWDRALKSLVAPDGAIEAEVRMLVHSLSAGVAVDDFSFSQ